VTLRVTRAGVVGAIVYLGAGAIWQWVAVPPGAPLAETIWFLAVALVGGFLPGVANQVTLSRAYLAAPGLAYALHGSTLGGLAVAVALAGLSDLADGTLARRFGATAVGAALDPVVDGIFFGAVGLGLWLGAAYPGWVALVVAARYGVPALVGAVLLAGGRRPQLRHTFFGQLSTTLIAILLGGVALLRGLGQDPTPVVVAGEIVIPVATLLTFGNLGWALRAKG
jgi:phosphatidylglycerophosphate synthase